MVCLTSLAMLYNKGDKGETNYLTSAFFTKKNQIP